MSCSRGENLLFEQLCFEVNSGQVCQIEGTNGAGKTSLLRILCGLSMPEDGRILWNGNDIQQSRERFHGALCFIGHLNGLKAELTGVENLKAYSSLRGVNQPDIPGALEHVGLWGYEDVPCRYLSAGQKRRVAIAGLLIVPAPLWILDEPITALDVAGIKMFEQLLAQHVAGGGLAVLTSHQELNVPDIVAVCL